MDFRVHKDNLVTLDLKVSLDVKEQLVFTADLAEEEEQVDAVMLDHQVIFSLSIVKQHQSQLALTVWLNCGMDTVCCTWKEARELMVKI